MDQQTVEKKAVSVETALFLVIVVELCTKDFRTWSENQFL